MTRREHSTEQLAQELSEYVERAAQQLAGGMREGDTSPGAPTLTRDEKLDYYHAMLFTPDGQPNIAGRQRFVTEIGPVERAKITDALLRRAGARQEEEASYG